MKPTKATLTGLVFCLCVLLTQAQEKYSKVKIGIPPGSERAVNKFLFDSLDADHFDYDNRSVIMEISQLHLDRLRAAGYPYTVLVDDVSVEFVQQSNIADFYLHDQISSQRSAFESPGQKVSAFIQTPVSFTPGSMGGYYTYDEMITKIDDMVTAYPYLVSKINIGTTYEGRTIWAIKVSDNILTDEAEPEVLYTGLQHAREAITGTSLIFFMQYLCENYGTDSRITDLVNNREIFIIPCVNVDGYVYNQTTNPSGGGMWRKNRRLNSGGSYGVDLNRNYGIDWGCCSGGSSTQSSETYWGTAAFSEPETAAMRAFVASRNFAIGFDQHCHGSYYSLPFGIEANHTLDAVDTKFYTFTPALIGRHNGHRAGNSIQTVGYNVAGGIKDWLLLGDIGLGSKGKVYGWTGEAGGGGFWASTANIIPLSKELCFQNLQIAYSAGSYGDIQDLGETAITSTSGNFGFQLRRIGLDNQPVTVTLVPVENIQTAGAPVIINSLANFHDTYTGNISYNLSPGIISGKRVRFVWRVESAGISYDDTITKFYNPIVLLSDDMEGTFSTNWTSTTNVGGNATAANWGFVTTQAYGGTKSMTESPSGDYTSNNIRTVTYKNTFNLSDATATSLSFWVRHKAENFRDKLQIQVATNGSNWTPVHGKNTVTDDNATSGGTLGGQPALTGIREDWTRELIDLSAFNGNASVSLRFQFTSDGDGGNFYKERDEGFFIDNVNVYKSTTTLSTLPAHFLSFTGRLMPDGTASLNWVAETDLQHKYFIIERSADGYNFVALGRKDEIASSYQYSDATVQTGNNYYRIKQVDQDGSITYSKVINIIVSPGNYVIGVYPNPVKDVLGLKILAPGADMIQVRVADMHGRIVFTGQQLMTKGPNQIAIPAGNWPSATYALTVMDSKGNLLSTEKLFKSN